MLKRSLVLSLALAAVAAAAVADDDGVSRFATLPSKHVLDHT